MHNCKQKLCFGDFFSAQAQK